MFCGKCGARLPEGTKMCPQCGEQLERISWGDGRCCVCGTPLSAEAATILVDRNGIEQQLCDCCEKQVQALTDGNKSDCEKAVAYFKKRLPHIPNPDTVAFFQQELHSQNTLLGIPEEDAHSQHEEAVQKADSYNVWIRGLRTVVLIYFWVFLLLVLVAGIAAMDLHFLVGLAVWIIGTLIAYFSVALVMVFLNLARDVEQTRNLLKVLTENSVKK